LILTIDLLVEEDLFYIFIHKPEKANITAAN